MGVSLDLRKAHKAHQIRDIICILTWVNDERAMVLMPAHRQPCSPWFVVCESALYKYDSPSYLARQCVKAAEVLGMDETSSSATRVADIILNFLPDLIRMPAAPDKEMHEGSFGTMQLMADGKLMRGEEIRLEKSGPTYG